jgi:hypothetical protein
MVIHDLLNIHWDSQGFKEDELQYLSQNSNWLLVRKPAIDFCHSGEFYVSKPLFNPTTHEVT